MAYQNLVKLHQKELFPAITESFVLCQHLQLGFNSTLAASNPQVEKRPSLVVCALLRPNQYVYCRW
mgnify:CR=1